SPTAVRGEIAPAVRPTSAVVLLVIVIVVPVVRVPAQLGGGTVLLPRLCGRCLPFRRGVTGGGGGAAQAGCERRPTGGALHILAQQRLGNLQLPLTAWAVDDLWHDFSLPPQGCYPQVYLRLTVPLRVWEKLPPRHRGRWIVDNTTPSRYIISTSVRP